MILTPDTYQTAVAYSDLGADRLLDHRGLARMLQEAASIASDECGYGLKDTPRTGVSWLLAAWRLELTERPAWRTALTVETWPRFMDGFRSERDYLVYADGRRIARGSSRWYPVHAETGKLMRISEEMKGAYFLEEGRAAFDEPLRSNGKSLPHARETFSAAAGRRDLDTNRHVNNIHYLEYALEALPEEVYQNLPPTAEIVFRRQILQGTAVRCLYALTGEGAHQVELCSGEGENTVHHAFVWFY